MNITDDNEMTIVDRPVCDNEESLQPEEKKEDKSNMWRQVAIGGVTGILLGVSGAAVASNVMDHDHPQDDTPITTPPVDDNQIDVASHVNDNMSFGDAFAAARAEVGPGGVFHWRGNVYSTYIEKEWNEMSSADRAAFGQRVAPEIARSDHHHQSHHQEAHHDHASGNHHETHHSDVSVADDDPDVRLIGVQDVTLEDGSVQTIGAATVNGYDVVLVDMNHNGEFDYAGIDVNRNGYIEAEERSDISDSHITVDSFREEAGNDLIVQQPTISDNGGQDGFSDMSASADWSSDDSLPDYTNDSDFLG